MSSLAYRDRNGRWHEVVIGQTDNGDWHVLDVRGEESEVIETLDGREDGLPQAEAIARDYLTTVQPGRSRGPASNATAEEGGTDADRDRRARPRPRDRDARGVALPRQAA